MIAALYVSPKGPYWTMPGVDPWDKRRDARSYSGPYPVVAHPPCAPWGRLRYARLYLCRKWGKDPTAERDCGPIAVEQVRKFGGVLEHPAGSSLWKHCGLPAPSQGLDDYGGRTVEVWQGSYGHPCPKHTWLYIVRCGEFAPRPKVDPGGRVVDQHSAARDLTPPELARVLVHLARSATPVAEVVA